MALKLPIQKRHEGREAPKEYLECRKLMPNDFLSGNPHY